MLADASGFLLNRLERRFQFRFSELFAKDLLHFAERNRRHPIEENSQLVGHRFADDVGRDAKICPNLTKVGPSFAKSLASLRRRPRLTWALSAPRGHPKAALA